MDRFERMRKRAVDNKVVPRYSFAPKIIFCQNNFPFHLNKKHFRFFYARRNTYIKEEKPSEFFCREETPKVFLCKEELIAYHIKSKKNKAEKSALF